MYVKSHHLKWLVAMLPFIAPLGCQTLPRQNNMASRGLYPPPPPEVEAKKKDPVVIQARAIEASSASTGVETYLRGDANPPPFVEYPIDLEAALELAGADNPTIALAQEAVAASRAQQLEAQALLLPSLNAGVGYDDHQGPLQTSTGVIQKVTRQSLYDGLGAAAVGAGTVGIPGVHLYADLADALFAPQAARERVAGRSFDAQATRNSILLEAVEDYFQLVGAAARLQAIRQSEAESEQIASITASFAQHGQGRQSDAERARGQYTVAAQRGAAKPRKMSPSPPQPARCACWTWTAAVRLLRSPKGRRQPSYNLWTPKSIWNRFGPASPSTIGRKSRRDPADVAAQ